MFGKARSAFTAVALTTGVSLVSFPFSTSATSETTTPPLHRLYVIGDSLTYGSVAFDAFPRRVKESKIWKSSTVDAVVGRNTMTGARIIQRKKLPADTAILVALGTNDMMSRREKWYPAFVIDEFMKAAKGRPVMWLNLEFDTSRPDWRSRGARFNRQLLAATSRWPNLTIADWDQFFTPKRKNRFARDGVHLNVEAYRLRGKFMLNELRTWSIALFNKTTTTTTTTTTLPATTFPIVEPEQPDENESSPTIEPTTTTDPTPP